MAHDHGVVAHLATATPNVLRELIQISLERRDLVSFAGGLPAAELFDSEGLEIASNAVFGSNSHAPLQYNATEGYAPLRARLGALTAARGVSTNAESIMVTSGSQQAIDLAARCLIAPGDVVLVERPTFITALQTFRAAQADLRDMASDAEGPVIDDIAGKVAAARAEGHAVKLIYLVPTFSNPAGRVISHKRRLALLELAAREQLTILEDDPYSELWFDAPPPPSLRALADGDAALRDQILYMSSLSKIVSPGLRVGWAVLPDVLIPHFRLMKSTADIHSSVLSQAIADQYLALGRLEARIVGARAAYAAKGKALATALQTAVGDRLVFDQPQGGMFLWARLTGAGNALAFARHALTEAGVAVVPGEPFFAAAPETHWLRLSFSQGGPAEFRDGAQRLARALAATPGASAA